MLCEVPRLYVIRIIKLMCMVCQYSPLIKMLGLCVGVSVSSFYVIWTSGYELRYEDGIKTRGGKIRMTVRRQMM